MGSKHRIKVAIKEYKEKIAPLKGLLEREKKKRLKRLYIVGAGA